MLEGESRGSTARAQSTASAFIASATVTINPAPTVVISRPFTRQSFYQGCANTLRGSSFKGQALLAHELTHAIQSERFG